MGGCSLNYYIDGKEDRLDKYPSLFWDEVKFEIPKKPFDLEKEYRKLERKEFVNDEKNCTIGWDSEGKKWVVGYATNLEMLGARYFKRDNLVCFVEKLDEERVTPKQLNEVIRKVEREEENVQDRGKSDS